MEEQKVKQKTVKRSLLALWLVGYFLIIAGIFAVLGYTVYDIDPLFHFHAPDTTKYYYELNSERNQNDGILRNFDYDAIVTGTSMSQNFKVSEVNELFGVNAVKTTFSGGSYKEISDRLKRGLSSNPNIKLVIRSLDMDFFFMGKDELGDQSVGDMPTYLYDDNILNDYKYLLNRDTLFNRVYKIKQIAANGTIEPGMTNFDYYSNWIGINLGNFGASHVIREPLENHSLFPYTLSDYDKITIKGNIQANIIDLANAYPDVEFYYFITPYGAAWWNINLQVGVMIRQIQAEQYIIELMLECKNIHLYSFNDNERVTLDLNNYKDLQHYGDWVNTAILRWMKSGTGLLTKKNYLEYIRSEYALYSTVDYTLLNSQLDYPDDAAYGAAWLESVFYEPPEEDTTDTQTQPQA